MHASADLVRHPASPDNAVDRLHVEVARTAGGGLGLRYRITGDIRRLRLPTPGEPLRTDGLWQHTCFEAFLRAADAGAYREFNFAPSGAWAAWQFAARRDGQSAPALPVPPIRSERGERHFVLEAALEAAALGDLAVMPIEAGIAAVIEDARGLVSYWALAHGAGAPDFHDPAAFTMRLAAP